jgi:co-chaperonin GroES (HSP10)
MSFLKTAEEVAKNREAVPLSELKPKKIRPLNKWVLIRKCEEKDKITADGFILPEGEGQQKSQLGEIVAFARGLEEHLEVGAQVIYTAFPMTFSDLERLTGDKMLDLVLFEEVYAVIEDA